MNSRPALVWCPFPDEEEARKVASQLLDEMLIGCANIIPGMVSLYEWEGERGEAQEVGVVFKTVETLLPKLVDRLTILHSYETPSITACETVAASKATTQWLGDLLNRRAASERG